MRKYKGLDSYAIVNPCGETEHGKCCFVIKKLRGILKFAESPAKGLNLFMAVLPFSTVVLYPFMQTVHIESNSAHECVTDGL